MSRPAQVALIAIVHVAGALVAARGGGRIGGMGTGGDPLVLASLVVGLPFLVLLILAAWGFAIPLVLADMLVGLWAIAPRDYSNALQGPDGPVIAACALTGALMAWGLRDRGTGVARSDATSDLSRR